MIILFAILILLDLYVYYAIRSLVNIRYRNLFFYIFWTFSILTIAAILVFSLSGPEAMPKKFRTYLFAVIVAISFSKLVAATFFLVDDIRRLFQWIAGKVFFSNTEGSQISDATISRSAFLSWLGVAAGSSLFGSLIYGFSNKYNYVIKTVQIPFPNLPPAFKGFRIVHFSDVHAGSFTNKKAVAHGVDMINSVKADLAIFSGDLVNDRASEMDNYKDVFNKVRATYGVFSTLGNHDYGDYATWPYQGVTKAQNLENLKKIHAGMGWKLMMNEHTVLEKDGQQIALLGVENWGAKARFPKFGDLEKAHAGTEKYPFKILISHDPSHWDAKVRPEFPDIDLTLSGHTHGMQFGVDIPGFQWSPVEYIYKEWKGLYSEGKQKIYVNPGYGFIGYPGRVGILPEITVIELV